MGGAITITVAVLWFRELSKDGPKVVEPYRTVAVAEWYPFGHNTLLTKWRPRLVAAAVLIKLIFPLWRWPGRMQGIRRIVSMRPSLDNGWSRFRLHPLPTPLFAHPSFPYPNPTLNKTDKARKFRAIDFRP